MKTFFRIFTLLIGFSLVSASVSLAQTKTHKLLIDLNSADTTDQAAVLRQIRNLWRELPDTKVEVLIHGQAISAIRKETSPFAVQIEKLQKEGVTFAVCRNTMKRYKLAEADMLSSASFVPSAIAETVLKQEEGWSYQKAGH
ncbi:DsrE family protein [Emticicia fluvialis]|uniref:DsrE family protein n=1 Tax=Emticicia fluvialis TaxID=2974474 RepID=UPI00216682B7|nr:DsrE family protein [Emticicia fluvialis]